MSESSATLRFLVDPPQTGAMNMALDESLLEHVGEGRTAPALRCYRWSPPTVSLGYFQTYAGYERLPPPAGDLDVTRRLTGGGAILHDLELTYSLALPVGHALLRDGAAALYGTMHRVIGQALGKLGVRAQRRGDCLEDSIRRGPFFCFSRQHCEDLVLGDSKLVGSAQRRTSLGVLQHGSIILGSRFDQQECAVAGLDMSDETLGELTAKMTSAFADVTGLSLSPAEWTDSEIVHAAELRAKYESDEWVRLR